MSKSSCTGKANIGCWDSGCRVPRECIDRAIAEASQTRAYQIGDAIADYGPAVVLVVGLLALAVVVMFG